MRRQLSRISVLTALLLAAGTAHAEEDWRSQWRAVLPAVPAPANPIEAEEVFWTYYVEAKVGARTCLTITDILSATYACLVSSGTTTAESSGIVMAALNYCVEVAAGSIDRADLFHALTQAGSSETTAMERKATRGEAIPFSPGELKRHAKRLDRRAAHLLRWKEPPQ